MRLLSTQRNIRQTSSQCSLKTDRITSLTVAVSPVRSFDDPVFRFGSPMSQAQRRESRFGKPSGRTYWHIESKTSYRIQFQASGPLFPRAPEFLPSGYLTYSGQTRSSPLVLSPWPLRLHKSLPKLSLMLKKEQAIIDVRSEGEFERGSFPGAISLPILTNEQRHEVGITYKTKGQTSATQLGYSLTSSARDKIVEGWSQAIQAKPDYPALVYCARGGLRSEIACQWMLEIGLKVEQVQGGFKALRKLVIESFKSYPPFIVIGGMTGSGKTTLLRQFKAILDLEKLANHRGSAFGSSLTTPQPSQIDFESQIALIVRDCKTTLLVEDESPNIGRCRLPEALYPTMAESPAVLIEEPPEVRARTIYTEYVLGASQHVQDINLVAEAYQGCVDRISQKLGEQRSSQIKKTNPNRL